MIVKIQIPLFSSKKGLGEALVYNKDRSFEIFLTADDILLGWMNGRPKVFFDVTVTKKGIEIKKEAEWQSW